MSETCHPSRRAQEGQHVKTPLATLVATSENVVGTSMSEWTCSEIEVRSSKLGIRSSDRARACFAALRFDSELEKATSKLGPLDTISELRTSISEHPDGGSRSLNPQQLLRHPLELILREISLQSCDWTSLQGGLQNSFLVE